MLTQPSSQASTETASTGLLRCYNCGQPYRPGELICPHCNARFAKGIDTRQIDLKDVPTNPIQPRGDAFVTSPKPIILYIEGQRLTLPEGFAEIVVGRHSPIAEDPQPDIDLSPFGAEEKGVSRRHIRLKHKNYLTYIIDLGSSNGTWLNGKRLSGPAERLLRNGDELRLGKLILTVRF
jgi:hypothetical protein